MHAWLSVTVEPGLFVHERTVSFTDAAGQKVQLVVDTSLLRGNLLQVEVVAIGVELLVRMPADPLQGDRAVFVRRSQLVEERSVTLDQETYLALQALQAPMETLEDTLARVVGLLMERS